MFLLVVLKLPQKKELLMYFLKVTFK